jgi:type II secretory pathway pseudopilin PulG
MRNSQKAFNDKYDALSLVEMLITIVILGMVLIVVSVTLTSMIKASAISSAKTQSRNESEFIFEVLKKHIKNADADQIVVYGVQGRKVRDNGSLINSDPGKVGQSFEGVMSGSGSVGEVLEDTGLKGNEIQLRPIGSSDWVCFALYPAENYTPKPDGTQTFGYLVKGIGKSAGRDCLEPGSTVVVTPLNIDDINVTDFDVSYYRTPSGNFSFIIDLEVEPEHWIPGSQSKFEPKYRRQIVVSTEKLTY